MRDYLPAWAHQWLGVIVPLSQVLLIVAGAWLLRVLAGRLTTRLAQRYDLPREVAVSARRLCGFLIYAGALLLILGRLGVSGAVLWTAFTGFMAVAAVALFAAWSVLSNIFCALLLMITRPFRLYDHIELLEGGDKPGLCGQVVDMDMVYVTLRERRAGGGESILRLPNSLFFQRVTRRWRGEPPPAPAPDTAAAGASLRRSGD